MPSFYLIFSKYVMSIFRTEHYMETWFAMAMAIRWCFHIFLLWDRLSYTDCLGSVNSPNTIILILLKKALLYGQEAELEKCFVFLVKTLLKGFTQVLVSFTYCQHKGSIQPLPLRQRYSPPLDPNAINKQYFIYCCMPVTINQHAAIMYFTKLLIYL